MTGAPRWLLVAAGSIVSIVTSTAQGQQPQFRAATDLVAVDVSVHRNNDPVRGLTPADFRITDNGVVQRVDVLEAAAMPIDVTLIVDTSTGTSGAFGNRASENDIHDQIRRTVSQIAGIVRPDDRLRLVSSDTYLRQVIPLAGVGGGLVDLPVLGQASTYDAIAAALLLPTDPSRRHLVVAWVKPVDTMSVTEEATLRDVARNSGAVLHIVERDLYRWTPGSPPIIPDMASRFRAAMTADREGTTVAFGGRVPLPAMPNRSGSVDLAAPDANRSRSYARSWQPFSRRSTTLLADLAAVTGGTYRGTGVLADLNAAEVFRDIFAAFREGYVLRYRPQGVAREGRHELTVSVPGHPNAIIRARRSYVVDRTAPADEAAGASPASRAVAATGAPAPPRSLDALVNLFDGLDDETFRQVTQRSPDLRRLLRDYRSAETPWPAQPHRESIFVLNLATAGLLSDNGQVRNEAVELLRHHASLVRPPFGADAFECDWYVTAVSATEAAYLADVTTSLASAGLARCPGEERLLLAKAVAADQEWSLGITRDRVAAPAAQRPEAGDVVRAYEVVIERGGASAPEAAVRAAWAAYRARDLEGALALLARVTTPSPDPIVTYYRRLVAAQVLRRLGRVDDALAAYRLALAAWPGAQSARVGLMTLLIEQGDRVGAAELSAAILTAPPTQVDPWWVYWLGSYRSFSEQLGHLRGMPQ